jgi:hypothetical protein
MDTALLGAEALEGQFQDLPAATCAVVGGDEVVANQQ